MPSCHADTTYEACCVAEAEHHSDDSAGHDDCADECRGYCCATVVTPTALAPIIGVFSVLHVLAENQPTARFYDVAHLIWQPPKRG